MSRTIRKTLSCLLALTFLLAMALPAATALAETNEALEAKIAEVTASNFYLCNFMGDTLDSSSLAKPGTGDDYAELNAKAVEITASCTTDYDKAYEINKWVADNIYYDRDHVLYGKEEHGMTAPKAYADRIAVCRGYALLMVAMCRAAGLPARYASGVSCYDENGEGGSHAWVEVYIDGKWHTCDPTWDSACKYQDGQKTHGLVSDEWFKCSNEEFSRTHYLDYYDSVAMNGDYQTRLVRGRYLLSYMGTAETLTVPEIVSTFSNVYRSNKTLKEVTLADSMTEIPVGFFSYCKNIQKINGMGHINKIGEYAFWGNYSLTEIYISASCTVIDKYAFGATSALKTIYYGGTKEQWEKIDIGTGNDRLSASDVTIIFSDTPHTFTETVITPATCSAEGSKKLVCNECGFTKTEAIAKTEHTYTLTGTKSATCSAVGTKTYTCSVCSATKTEEIAKTAHSYKYAVTKAATCTESGIGTYTCSACSDKKTQTIPATGHTDANADNVCDSCGIEINKTDSSGSCSHICHKGGISGFFWKIINLFNKLFKINQFCTCGKAHW